MPKTSSQILAEAHLLLERAKALGPQQYQRVYNSLKSSCAEFAASAAAGPNKTVPAAPVTPATKKIPTEIKRINTRMDNERAAAIAESVNATIPKQSLVNEREAWNAARAVAVQEMKKYDEQLDSNAIQAMVRGAEWNAANASAVQAAANLQSQREFQTEQARTQATNVVQYSRTNDLTLSTRESAGRGQFAMFAPVNGADYALLSSIP